MLYKKNKFLMPRKSNKETCIILILIQGQVMVNFINDK